jgi:hypothetical protein
MSKDPHYRGRVFSSNALADFIRLQTQTGAITEDAPVAVMLELNKAMQLKGVCTLEHPQVGIIFLLVPGPEQGVSAGSLLAALARQRNTGIYASVPAPLWPAWVAKVDEPVAHLAVLDAVVPRGENRLLLALQSRDEVVGPLEGQWRPRH